eukprot:scaffold63016_cov20-Prasinocladus_malaysianus.AAC.1
MSLVNKAIACVSHHSREPSVWLNLLRFHVFPTAEKTDALMEPMHGNSMYYTLCTTLLHTSLLGDNGQSLGPAYNAFMPTKDTSVAC